jgi:hypothetical protein
MPVLVHSPGADPQTVSDAGHPQTPLHIPPVGHGVPALPASPTPQAPVAPQCCVLLLGSMHAPPQLISVPGHVAVQPPAPLQTSPIAWQLRPALPPATPQPNVAPQWTALVAGSMQLPPQFTSAPGQVTWHPVGVHTSPRLRQLAPALPVPAPQPVVAPQYWLLLAGSTHVPLQLISLPGQVIAQPFGVHTSPRVVQFWPALPIPPVPQPAVAPQYWLLDVGSMHVPLQLISLPGHETPHCPLAQTSPDGHCVPVLPAPPAPQPAVAPQWCWSDEGSTHLPPQLISLPGHETEHVPPLQTCPDGHCVPGLPAPPAPHAPVAPQYWSSFDGSMHKPLQFTSLAGHATEHLPALHALPVGQATPHPPQ